MLAKVGFQTFKCRARKQSKTPKGKKEVGSAWHSLLLPHCPAWTVIISLNHLQRKGSDQPQPVKMSSFPGNELVPWHGCWRFTADSLNQSCCGVLEVSYGVIASADAPRATLATPSTAIDSELPAPTRLPDRLVAVQLSH